MLLSTTHNFCGSYKLPKRDFGDVGFCECLFTYDKDDKYPFAILLIGNDDYVLELRFSSKAEQTEEMLSLIGSEPLTTEYLSKYTLEGQDMKQGKTYFKTSDLQEYKVVGEEIIIPEGLVKPQKSYVLHCLRDSRIVVRVYENINMGTTREWATTKKMAIANKIKLLENEIVSLNFMKDGLI